jgi:hypothetical protein
MLAYNRQSYRREQNAALGVRYALSQRYQVFIYFFCEKNLNSK